MPSVRIELRHLQQLDGVHRVQQFEVSEQHMFTLLDISDPVLERRGQLASPVLRSARPATNASPLGGQCAATRLRAGPGHGSEARRSWRQASCLAPPSGAGHARASSRRNACHAAGTSATGDASRACHAGRAGDASGAGDACRPLPGDGGGRRPALRRGAAVRGGDRVPPPLDWIHPRSSLYSEAIARLESNELIEVEVIDQRGTRWGNMICQIIGQGLDQENGLFRRRIDVSELYRCSASVLSASSSPDNLRWLQWDSQKWMRALSIVFEARIRRRR